MDKTTRITKYMISFLLIILICFETCYCGSITSFKNKKVIIIGAGPAGIAAASKLFENGFTNVKILEAEDRIGGRVYTTRLGNYSVDLGAQWVHGQEGNVAYDLAYPLGLLEVSENSHEGLGMKYLESSGDSVNDNLSNKLVNFLNDYVFGSNFTDEISIGEYVDKMFNEEFKDNPEVLKNKEKYLHPLELMRLTAESAESWYDISTSDSYVSYPGDQAVNWKERGYSTILDILMKRYPNPEEELPVLKNTVLNTEVTQINYSNTAKGLPVSVMTRSGEVYEADHIIITVSLGVLKENYEKLFIPPLPKYKVNAIESLGFGSAAKIFLLFDKPFWDVSNEVLRFAFLWNDADRKIIEADSEKKWLLGVFGAMTVEHKPNLLILWTTGKDSNNMEKIPEDKIFNHVTENLHRFLGKMYNVTEPLAMLRTQWHINPHFRGTYSYPSIESEERNIHPEILEKPLSSKLDILFAGEATSKDRYSTVDGAIGSGWKAVNRIIDYYKN